MLLKKIFKEIIMNIKKKNKKDKSKTKIKK